MSSTSLAHVAGIQAQIDAINNKKYGAISTWVTNDVDQTGKIRISDPKGKISLSYKTVSEFIPKTPTYAINKCIVSNGEG